MSHIKIGGQTLLKQIKVQISGQLSNHTQLHLMKNHPNSTIKSSQQTLHTIHVSETFEGMYSFQPLICLIFFFNSDLFPSSASSLLRTCACSSSNDFCLRPCGSNVAQFEVGYGGLQWCPGHVVESSAGHPTQSLPEKISIYTQYHEFRNKIIKKT